MTLRSGTTKVPPTAFRRLVFVFGMLAFLTQCLFPMLVKGGTSWTTALWFGSGIVCIAGAAVYFAAGRFLFPDWDRTRIRRAFRPAILGATIFLCTLVFMAIFALFVSYQATS